MREITSRQQHNTLNMNTSVGSYNNFTIIVLRKLRNRDPFLGSIEIALIDTYERQSFLNLDICGPRAEDCVQ